jgi:hypothetical protein
MAAWEAASPLTPSHLPRYTARQQKETGRQVEMLLDRFQDDWDHRGFNHDAERRLIAKQARLATTRLLLCDGNPAVEAFMRECESAATTFIQTARSFDAGMSMPDILQALRNQWVFNSIQTCMGKQVSVTPSSFAYSMLYPYTDNSIDAASATDTETASFISWLGTRLRGIAQQARGLLTLNVSRLLDMIEKEYPRSRHPEVHESLLAIHRAQGKSLSLRHVQESDSERALLLITIEKGGTSVLTDGYLVCGELSDVVAGAMYAYGVVLQLLDDLQDLVEDRSAGCSTPFTRAADRGELTATTNRLFACVEWCRQELCQCTAANAAFMPDLIARSCNLLILESVARYRTCYEPAYLRDLEQYMPLPIDTLAGLYNRTHALVQKDLFTKLGEPHYAA